ncbi:polyphenol oxidase [Candidatus Hakubella thermalkaliphila]|uniref:Purine nucleoside phosphorylase n=1 Tax=Candidatus Hakubella thermalkaliphila TaxID=2754717 RepID=A0A6V8PXR6_9ACTN|nr:peptidoglycan editing factor PgeF [Candidatus Hakubella thermalkaliphila]GFP36970.1 polyphenol oxidase [Candidatus Hakubella thermalkaliphila]GFP39051.1 polyphenol oxidase [Candidatus Hakubella thermalkaliphila]
MGQLTLRTRDGVRYFLDRKLKEEGFLVALTTRLGGISQGSYATLNLSFKVGDEEERVIRNRSKLFDILDLPLEQLTCAEQVHGDRVFLVTKELAGRGAFSQESSISGTDAMITREANLPLAMFYADCLPIIMVSPSKRIAAIVHAGWKGTYAEVSTKTLRHMRRQVRDNLEDLAVYFGPSIRGCCYQVDGELFGQFRKKFPLHSQSCFIQRGGSYFLDLEQINKESLKIQGVKETRMVSLGHCTACHNDLYFSFRKSRRETGRQAGVVCIL